MPTTFGLDRLLNEPQLRKPLIGKRLALLAHPASVTRDLTHSMDALASLPDQIMKIGLGGFLILYSFYSLFIPRLPVYDKNWLAMPTGVAATSG